MEELGSGLLAFFSILASPTIKSGLLQEHVLEFQNVQTTLDQCQPQYCWHFVPDDSLLCGAVLYIIGLTASLASAHEMLVAPLPSVVTTQNDFRHCQMSQGAQKLRTSALDLTGDKYRIWDFLFLSFPPKIMSLPISSHQEAGRNITQVTLCLCFFLF